MASTTSDNQPKKLRCIQRSADPHWVGDGFPVRTLFAYPNLGRSWHPSSSSTTPVPWTSRRRPNAAAWASTRTVGSSPSWPGPFVVNNGADIRQAMVDYQSGKMGRLA
jgi:hypothetical protein